MVLSMGTTSPGGIPMNIKPAALPPRNAGSSTPGIAPIRPRAGQAVPREGTGDGVALTGSPGEPPMSRKDLEKAASSPGVAALPCSEATGSAASQALSTAGKAAAAAIGGPAGLAVGVTIESLKEAQKEIEKGYHLPENFICAYYERRILPYQQRPTYTATDDYLYRGMYITVDELANILKNGFEVKYNTWSAVGGKGVYFSSSIREADDYIFQAVDFHKKNALGVVFKMEKGGYAQAVEDPVHNSTKTIYKAPGDVPKDKIAEIYLRGEYGLERLGDIIDKARSGGVKPNSSWVNQFDGYMMR